MPSTQFNQYILVSDIWLKEKYHRDKSQTEHVSEETVHLGQALPLDETAYITGDT